MKWARAVIGVNHQTKFENDHLKNLDARQLTNRQTNKTDYIVPPPPHRGENKLNQLFVVLTVIPQTPSSRRPNSATITLVPCPPRSTWLTCRQRSSCDRPTSSPLRTCGLSMDSQCTHLQSTRASVGHKLHTYACKVWERLVMNLYTYSI